MSKNRLLLMVLSACLSFIIILTGCTNSEQKFRKLMEQAQVKFEEGDYSNARIDLLKAIKVNPSSSEAYYLAAKTMARLQDYQGAYSAYESAVELDPDNQEILLDFVAFLLAGKGYDRAVSLLRGALEKNPEDTVLRRQLSRALAGTDEKSLGVEIANQLVNEQPESAENWLNLAALSILTGDTAGAGEALENARKVAPLDDPRVVLTEVDLLIRSGRLDDAVYNLQMLVRKDPGNIGYALRLGYLLERTGQTEEAMGLYRGVLDHEDSPSVRNRLGFLHSLKGENEEAVAQWERVLERHPKAIEPRLGIAKVKLQKGDERSAWRLVGEVLDIDAENTEAIAMRGMMSYDRGDFSGAVLDLEKAVSRDPGEIQWRLALADACLGKGEAGKARRILEEVLVSDPDNAKAHLTLARILAREGRYSESSRHAEKAAAAQQYFAEAVGIQGSNALVEGNPRMAAGLFEKALKSNPDNPGLWIRLATALGAMGETERSVGILKKLLDERPKDLLPLTIYAGILNKAGRSWEALTLVRDHYREDSPGHGLLLAETLERAGEKEEAEKTLHSVVENNPEFGPAYYRVVAFYSRNGRLDEAGNWLEQAVKSKKKDRYGLYLLLGMLQEKAGDRKAAVESYRTALDENPDFVPALNNLAWALAEEGNLDEALRISSRGRVIDPEDAFMADTHGWILYLSGDAAGALPLIRQAAADQPSNVAIRDHLVKVLDAVGRADEANRQRDILQQQKNQ